MAVVADTQHGLGAPLLEQGMMANASSTLFGQVSFSDVHTNESFFPRVSNSKVSGNRLIADSIDVSQIKGDDLQLSVIKNSLIHGNNSGLSQLDNSRVTVNKSMQQSIQSEVQGNEIMAHSLLDSNVSANASSILNVVDVDADVENALLDNVQMGTLLGRTFTLKHVDDAHIYGDLNSINHGHGVHLLGDNNGVNYGNRVSVMGNKNKMVSVESVRVVGDGNIGMHVSDLDIIGNNQRILSDDVRVQGDNNLVIGDHVQLHGNRNMVLNATNEPMVITGNQQLVMQAPGGVYIQTGDGMVVSATPSSGGWTMVSDKNLKTNIQTVDYKSVFDALMAVPVQQWEYDFNRGTQHIGPMAQDFKAHFNVGEDERFITNSDADRVAFAALKHLISEMDALQLRMAAPGHSDIENLDHLLDGFDSQIQSYRQSLKLKRWLLSDWLIRTWSNMKRLINNIKLLGICCVMIIKSD